MSNKLPSSTDDTRVAKKRPAEAGLPDDEPATKRACFDNDATAVVPLVYQEGKEVIAIALWFADRVDEVKRKIIFDGLRGKDKIEWVYFLVFADEPQYYDGDLVLPKELEGLKPPDLGVVLCEPRTGFFSVDNCAF
jgi:hypothetical protein